MTDQTGGVHVVVGRGPLGKAVVDELLAKGNTVRVIGASAGHSAFADNDGVSEETYDVSQSDQAQTAFRRAAVVYQCAGPPYHLWTERFPDFIEGIIDGAQANHTKLVVGDNLYMYGEVPEPMTELLPYRATTKKGKVRAKAAERLLKAHEAGEVEVTIGRGSDFFGPHVLHSSIGRVFPQIVNGKKATVLGDPDQLHTYTFIADFAKALVILGENEEAFGDVWHVPNAQTITTREFLTEAYRAAGYPPRIKRLGKGMLQVGGLFNRDAKEVKELFYQFEKPFIVDDAKFVKHFGDCSTTFDKALAKTVAWFQNQ